MRVITRSYKSITRSYESITRSYRRERERVRTIGLDWSGRGWRGGSLVLKGIAASLIFSAYPSRPLSPHSSLSQSLSTPHSTSI